MVADDDVWALVEALAKVDPAPTLAEFAAALGADPAAFADVLTRALEGGLVEAWPTDKGTRYVLSPLSLERLGLVLIEDARGDWRWRPAGDPLPPIKAKGRVVEPLENDEADLSADPALIALEAETADRFARRLEDHDAAGGSLYWAPLPPPRHLLGSSRQWDGPLVDRPCPVCTGVELARSDYCLVCGRWGLDDLLAKVAPEARRQVAKAERAAAKAEAPRVDVWLAGGRGKARPGKVKAITGKPGRPPLGPRLKGGLGTLTVA